MTQVYKYRAEVGSNWKLFIDAFAEFYHAPVLHAKQAIADESRKLQGYGFEALAYELDGPHGMVSSWGGMAPPKDLEHGEADRAGAAQRPVRPVGRARHRARRAAAGAQPGPPPDVGRRLVRVLPQLHAARLGAGLVPHLPLLADVVQHPHLRGHAVLRAAEERPRAPRSRSSPRSRSRSTRSRTATRSRRRRRCSSPGPSRSFPLNDQEILLRHLHKTARDYVADYQQAPPTTPVRISAAS